jgi:molecular chaperone DnaJ
VEIPTLDGKAKIKIEPGTQSGKVLRLRNKGLPAVNSYGNNYGKGDLLINIAVYTPENLTQEQKGMLEKLETAPNFQPTKSIKDKIFNRFKNIFE